MNCINGGDQQHVFKVQSFAIENENLKIKTSQHVFKFKFSLIIENLYFLLLKYNSFNMKILYKMYNLFKELNFNVASSLAYLIPSE